jgi:hypothetical protein
LGIVMYSFGMPHKLRMSLHELPKDVIHVMEVVSVTQVPLVVGTGSTVRCIVKLVETGEEFQDTSSLSQAWAPGARFTSQWDGRAMFPSLKLIE